MSRTASRRPPAPDERRLTRASWIRGLAVAGALLGLQALAALATRADEQLSFNWFRALALPLLSGYVVGILPALSAALARTLRELAASLPGGREEAEAALAAVSGRWRRRWALSIGAGLVVPLGVASLLTERAARVLAGAPIDLYFAFAAITFWTLAAQTAVLILEAGALLRRLARDRVRVDLFHLEALRPFGAFGLRQALAVVGALALAVALLATPEAERAWLVSARLPRQIPLIVPTLAATLLLAVAAFVQPMWAIRRRVQQEKRALLDRVAERVGPHWEETADLDGEGRLLQLPGLLALRQHVAQLTEWPVDDSMKRRFGLYLLIPLLSLTLKALLESALTSIF